MTTFVFWPQYFLKIKIIVGIELKFTVENEDKIFQTLLKYFILSIYIIQEIKSWELER